MSLITRCPACQTLFRVVPDQLRISEGWVRCGSCQAVFDASLHLVVDSAQTNTATNLDTGADQLALNGDAADPVPLAVQVASDQRLPSELLDAATDIHPESAEPSAATFLNAEPMTIRAKMPMRRFVPVALIVALIFGVAGQVVRHERDRIAALQPALRPWLAVFCRAVNCQLSPLRQKDSITIDRASFSKITENSYRLNFTVKNTGTVALAAPAIELTLTDTSDNPVLRRVFLPAELGFKSDILSAAEEWTASLAVAIDLAGIVPQTVGYRIYAFYP